jgi:phosphatidate cytidylyltransferase
VLALAAGLAAASWLAPQPLGAAGASLAMVAIAVPLLRGALPNGAGATLLAGVYPTLGLAQIALLGAGENGFGRVLFLYAIVEMNDAFALLGGRLLGRHRPWPTLSPNKTAEGAAVGLLASLGASVLFAFAVPELGLVQRLAIGLLVGLAVQAGDLVASAVKRRAGIKDYGTVVPGSGGVLDVYDSLAFAAPFYALLLS